MYNLVEGCDEKIPKSKVISWMLPRRDSVAPAQIDWSELDKKRYYFFGPSLFLCVRAAIYPSNLVKTRLQVSANVHAVDLRFID